VLTRLNVNNPILRIFSEYGTPQGVKNFALSVLAPYFLDQGMLNTLAVPVLVTEAVNVDTGARCDSPQNPRHLQEGQRRRLGGKPRGSRVLGSVYGYGSG
jgi:hypothetical protein